MEKGGGVPLQGRGEAGQGSVRQCGAVWGSLMSGTPLCNMETAVFSQIHLEK